MSIYSAIHKKTGKEFPAWIIWRQGLFENQDPHKEEWIALADDIENYELLKREIPLVAVVSYPNPKNPNRYIPSFFRLPPGLKDIVIKKGESTEHKMKKTFVSVLLTKECSCSLQYDNETYPIKTIPVDYDKLLKNPKLIEVTKHITTTGKFKRADVGIPLIPGPIFGTMLIVEIRESETKKTEEEKEDFWFARTASVIWVDREDFMEEDGDLCLKKNSFNVIPYCIGYERYLKKREEKCFSFLRDALQVLEEVKNNQEDIKIEYSKSINEIKTKYDDFLRSINKESILEEINGRFEEREHALQDLIDVTRNLVDIDSFKDDVDEIITEGKKSFKEEHTEFLSDIHDFVTSLKKTCRTCLQASKSRDDPELIACWVNTTYGKNGKKGFRKYPSLHEPLDGCREHENR